MNWSKYQLGVFDFNLNSTSNAVVNAVAGSGKSTVIVKCIEDVPFSQTVLAVAFSKQIELALTEKLKHMPNVTVKTLNGFGYASCRTVVKRYIKLKKEKTQDTMFFDIFGGHDATKEQKELYYKSRYLICKIIEIWKADMVWSPSVVDLRNVMDRFNLDLPKGTTEVQMADLAETTFVRCMAKKTVLDFNDQIAMPLMFDWPIATYDRVFVDEAQDLTPAQIELTRRALNGHRQNLDEPGDLIDTWRSPGKAIYVGDPRQAIYQFRGADSQAIANIISTMVCEELPLSICYRCSKAVVRLAQKLVPHIEYHEDAPEGSESVVTPAEFDKLVTDGDLVLSRCTAPLVQACMSFIRQERKATIKGREIGEQLIHLIEHVADGAGDLDTFNDRLIEYVRVQEEKLTRSRREDALIALNDTYETILALYERAESVSQLTTLISKIFSDTVVGIKLMTVHKAKGLEETNVFIIAPELMPHKMAITDEAKLSEENLAYVAITRAKLNLYFVGKYPPILEGRNAGVI